MSIGRLLNISVSTMSAYQQAMNVASNNISNAGNADYARQQVILGTAKSDSAGGMGVRVLDVQRVKDSLLGVQIQKYQSDNSEASKRSDILNQVESILAEPSDNGLATYFQNFFNAWDELTTNPNSVPARLNIIQQAQNLSDRFKDTYDGLSDVQGSLQDQAVTDVATINGYLKQITDYNQQIYAIEVTGNKANEIRDQRDALVDKLSQLVNVSVQEGSYGTVNVNVGGIQGADVNSYNQFELKSVNGQMKMVSTIDGNSTALVNSGSLYAEMDLYSNKIPAYKTQLDQIANVFTDKVNQLHMAGNTLIQGTTSSTGIPFFGQADGSGNVTNAYSDGKINISTDVLNNPNNIAASDEANNDGNSNAANQIARLGDQSLAELNGQSFLESYTTLLNNIGIEKTTSDNKLQSSDTILQQLNSQKASTSGVSIDEEMTNILKFQRSYDAAAKLIKISDEMILTILNMVG